MGWRPDWAGAAKGGLEALEDIILGVEKEKKRRKKVDDELNKQMELLDYQQKLGIDRGKMETYWEIALNENFNRETRQHFAELGGLIPQTNLPGMGIAPAPPGIPTTARTTMPGGVAGMGELPPLRPEAIASARALIEPSAVAEEEEGEMFGVVEKEKTHKEKVTRWVEKHPGKPYPGLTMEQTHKVLGAYIPPEKGPTVAERRLGMDAASVASLIRQGLRTEKTTFGEERFPLTSKEEAINFAGEMGWTADTPEYQQHIAPAVEDWWGTYRPEEIKKLQLDKAVRRKAFKALRKAKKIGLIREFVPIGNRETIDVFIKDNWQIMDKSLEEIVKEMR